MGKAASGSCRIGIQNSASGEGGQDKHTPHIQARHPPLMAHSKARNVPGKRKGRANTKRSRSDLAQMVRMSVRVRMVRVRMRVMAEGEGAGEGEHEREGEREREGEGEGEG